MNRILFSLAISVSFFATDCSKHTEQNINPGYYSQASGTGKNYLALGDSYTIGQSVDSLERFPSQTAVLLKEKGININEPEYIATTGWTTDNLFLGIMNRYPAKSYDVVSLLIGVNDQYQQRDTTGYRQRFLKLLGIAKTLAAGNSQHVVVLSIPDYSVTPFATYSDTSAIRREIDWFNAINQDVTAQEQCLYLDITGFTREARTDPGLIAMDGLHPSGKEYQVWAKSLLPLIYPMLK